jgi:hypothetical protein
LVSQNVIAGCIIYIVYIFDLLHPEIIFRKKYEKRENKNRRKRKKGKGKRKKGKGKRKKKKGKRKREKKKGKREKKKEKRKVLSTGRNATLF